MSLRFLLASSIIGWSGALTPAATQKCGRRQNPAVFARLALAAPALAAAATDSEARADAFPRVLEFLKLHLEPT
jgi:hypothetical protein